jgi:hypothetical protein
MLPVDKDTGVHINVGVVDFHNISIVKDYFARLNVPLTNPGPYLYPTLLFDFDTGFPVPGYVPASQAAVSAALLAYIDIIATNYSYLQAGYFLPDPVPEELLIPFGEFATRHGLQAAVQTLNQFLQNDGNIWEVPTVQILKACDITLVQSALTGFLTVTSGDTQDLYTSATAVLGQDVLYSSEVTQMNRSEYDGVSLVVQTPSGRKLVWAKRLIVTIPPILDLLYAFDLSSEETSIFGKFLARGYYGAIFTHSGINDTELYTNIGTHTPFNLQVLPGIFTIQPTGLLHKHKVYFGTLDPTVSSQAAQQMIVEQIDTLQANGAFPADTPEFLFFTNHAPFRTFVAAEDIEKGFYRDLYGLQGQQNTFWTGASWMTQDSSLIWNFTEAQVLPAIIQSLDG